MYTLGTARDYFKCLLLLDMQLKQGRVRMIQGFVGRTQNIFIILLQLTISHQHFGKISCKRKKRILRTNWKNNAGQG